MISRRRLGLGLAAVAVAGRARAAADGATTDVVFTAYALPTQ